MSVVFMNSILGNFNAKLETNVTLRPNVGSYGLHKLFNSNGLRFAKLAASNDFLIKSTM